MRAINPDFYAINTMIDTSISFEMKAKEEKVKMFASIFAFFIVVAFMISAFFIFDLNNLYNIIGIVFIEIMGLISCIILDKYRRSCKSYLIMYRKSLHDIFTCIFEYERYVNWENEYEKHLIKQRLLLVNPSI
ncbi:hypothetical protein ACTOJ1_000209 [Shigella flexneri]